jgi:CRP-like cAMP-binding protein
MLFWGLNTKVYMEELRSFLENFPMLRPDEVQLILDHSTVREFKKGTFLLKSGDVSKHCYLVLSGCVREYFYKEGEEKTVAFYTEGEPVNDFSSAASGMPAKHNLVCLEDCLLTVGTQALEDQMCRLIPRLESIIRQEVEKYTGQAKEALAKFMTTTPEERYLDVLQNRPDLLQRVPQHQLASYIGIAPESLSRIRKRLMEKDTGN